MEKVLRLKSAAMILFWFGVIAQFITVMFVVPEYVEYGYSPFLTDEKEGALTLNNAISFAWYGFIHLIHVVAGYLLAKGKKKGVVLGIGMSLLEIIGAFLPGSIQYIQTLGWITIRLLFVIVILLIISGRKELDYLKSENWRPWKDPRKLQLK